MAKFKLKDGEQVRTQFADIESATVIAAGDLVTLTSGYITLGAAASTAFAWCPKGSADGETTCEVTVGNDFTLVGTADAAYAITDKGATCGIDDTTQKIDLGDSSSELTIMNGTAGSASDVEVRIAAPLF